MKKISFVILFVVLGFFLDSFLVHGAEETKDRASLRFQKLVKEYGKNLPIKFDSTKLKTYLESAHNYSFILFFTTDDPKVGCQMCKPVESVFKESVTTFLSSNDLASKKFLQNPFFFGTCDVRDCYDIFVQAKFNTVPKLIYVRPKEEKGPINFDEWEEYQIYEMPTVESIFQFVTEKTDYFLIVEKSIIDYIGTYGIAIVAIGFVFRAISKKFKNPMFWFALTMCVFAISMAGFVFNAINKPPFSYRNPQNQQVHYFYPSPRQQFQIEGVIMAGLLSGVSLSIVSFVHFVPTMNTANQQRLAFFFFFLLFGLLYHLVFKIFKIKHSYYPL